MCRSKNSGGRRCPGHARGSQAAPSQSTPSASAFTSTTTSPDPAPPGQRPPTTTAPPVGTAEAKRAARAAARVQEWARAEKELSQATADVEGSTGGNTASAILLNPLSRQVDYGDLGGDPAVFTRRIERARAQLTDTLTGRGNSPDVAAAKVARLENAYHTWSATPEAHPDPLPTSGGGSLREAAERARSGGAKVTFVGGDATVGQVIGSSDTRSAAGAGSSGSARVYGGWREAAEGAHDGGPVIIVTDQANVAQVIGTLNTADDEWGA